MNSKLREERSHDLSILPSGPIKTPQIQPSQQLGIIMPYARFANRIRHVAKELPTDRPERDILIRDPAIIEYFNALASSRHNAGLVSHDSQMFAVQATRRFLNYVNRPITDSSLNELVQYKMNNPLSRDIEKAVRDYSNIPSSKGSVKLSRRQAATLCGIFARNFAPLAIKIDTHSQPTTKDCPEKIFLSLYHNDLSGQQELKDLIQWNIYVPERVRAANMIPFSDIDLTADNHYAIVTIHGETPNIFGVRSKARIEHPCFVPLKFAERIISNSKAARRKAVFPNYASAWKTITTICEAQYKVNIRSNRTRKFFAEKADSPDSHLSASISAYIMGDKTKLALAGHIAETYNPLLHPEEMERLLQTYKRSNMDRLLSLENKKPTIKTLTHQVAKP